MLLFTCMGEGSDIFLKPQNRQEVPQNTAASDSNAGDPTGEN